MSEEERVLLEVLNAKERFFFVPGGEKLLKKHRNVGNQLFNALRILYNDLHLSS
jgi:hypothetical protein